MAKKKTTKIAKKTVTKPKDKRIKQSNKKIEKTHNVKTINTNKHHECFDIKHGLKQFIYGAIFGALLMLIIIRMLQLV